MSKILYIEASPRGERSKSVAVARAFLEAYGRMHPDDEIETLNVFREDLIAFDGLAVQAKYTILHGKEHSQEELTAWKAVEAAIERFASSDKYVMAVPMWNFSIPYRLKQYIDILVQPGYTFSYSPDEGYKGLIVGKPVFVAYSRGGDYSRPETRALNLQSKYLELILGFIGFVDIRSVVVEPTLEGGPAAANKALERAVEKAQKMAETF